MSASLSYTRSSSGAEITPDGLTMASQPRCSRARITAVKPFPLTQAPALRQHGHPATGRAGWPAVRCQVSVVNWECPTVSLDDPGLPPSEQGVDVPDPQFLSGGLQLLCHGLF